MIETHYNFISSTGFVRPAKLLVHVSNTHLSKLVLEYNGNSVEVNYSPESLMDVMSLEIIPGAQFTIRAEGVDEYQALQSIEEQFKKMKLIN